MKPKVRRLVVNIKKADSFQHKLTGFHKAGILVLLAFIVSQSLIILNVADAGETTAKSLLACTNEIRLNYQKNELVINEKLNEAAQKKLEDMIKYGYWAHENPETHKKPWDFVDESGYYYETTGENLALGFDSAQLACDAWEKSKTHLANIADPTFEEIGFAIDKANLHKNGKGILIVQMFGNRKDFGGSPGTVLGSSTATTSQIQPAGSATEPASTAPDSASAPDAATPSVAPAEPIIQTDSVGNLYEQTGSISLHPSSDESTFMDLLKTIMPYITALFYVTTIIAVIVNRISNKKNKEKGFGNGLALILAISSIFATLVYLVLT